MNDSAFRVPDVLAVEANAVAYLKPVDSRGEVDVVCYEQCLSCRKLNDEPLVSRSFKIVCQKANHSPLTFDLYVACSTRERAADGVGRRTRTGA